MENSATSYIFRNRVIDKGQLKKIVSWSFSHYGLARATMTADQLKDLGFSYATKAGISLSIEDLKVPETKRSLIDDTFFDINETEYKFLCGEITSVERFQKVIDTWNDTSEALKDEIVKYFKETDPLNSIYMMAFSGARGNISQVRQLVGMRGLMSDPQGQIIDIPIKSNFREGLNVTEYIISSYGARKGLVDTALKTADSGYLTRRLVDVAQDIIVREVNCGTKNGILVNSKVSEGRILLNDFLHPVSKEVIAYANSAITSNLVEFLETNNIENILVRSSLTCESQRSVCQFCYGWNLAYGRIIDLGEAVGIIAAQSIGEPGTQLTMRTFHTGGVFTGESSGQLKAPFKGIVKFPEDFKFSYVRTRHGNNARLLEQTILLTLDGNESKTTFTVTPDTLLLVHNGQHVRENQILSEKALDKTTITERATKDVITNISGEVLFGNLVVEERIDKQGNSTIVNQKPGLVWILSGDVYEIPSATQFLFKEKSEVNKGFVLSKSQSSNTLSGFVLGSNARKGGLSNFFNTVSSIILENADFTKSTNGNLIKFKDQNVDFTLKIPLHTPITDSQVIAEQINSEYVTSTGGTIFVEESESSADLLWIPEETYEINKDLSLLLVDDSTVIDVGTEIISEVFSKTGGFLKITHQNNILKEVSIKPGVFHPLPDSKGYTDKDKVFVKPGEVIFENIIADKLTYLEVVNKSKSEFGILARPVTTYKVDKEEKVVSSKPYSENLSKLVKLKILNQFSLKNGTSIKSCEGIKLVDTNLILEMDKSISGLISLDPKKFEVHLDSVEVNSSFRLQINIHEDLSFYGDSIQSETIKETKSFTDQNQFIKPSTVIIQNNIVSSNKGKIQQSQYEVNVIKKVVITSNSDEKVFSVRNKNDFKLGDFVRLNSKSGSHDTFILGQIISNEFPTFKIRTARPYLISQGAVLNVNHGNLVQQGDLLSVLVYERPKTGDIVQGLPRIEEILEARRPKNSCELAPIDGQVSLDLRGEIPTIVISNQDTTIALTQKLDKGFLFSDHSFVKVGQPLTDGKINPHDLLGAYFAYYKEKYDVFEASRLSLQRIQLFLVREVQNVYASQGVTISDKHVEVIVRQMTSKVRVIYGGNTTLLPDELVDLHQIKRINNTVTKEEFVSADYYPILLGITKASLNTESFISAASFQETTRVLTDAAIEGKTDWLHGLKENVIIGRLIPAGTGFDNLYNTPFSDQRNPSSSIKALEESKIEQLDHSSLDFDDIILDDRTARILNTNNDYG
jgi:DNA-directed RNA polymerase subunit beta'